MAKAELIHNIRVRPCEVGDHQKGVTKRSVDLIRNFPALRYEIRSNDFDVMSFACGPNNSFEHFKRIFVRESGC